ncbi:MAG: hypothetical protein KTR30_10730 [Saprospiraceae bacterium]|nr:hypothetical protein [Saprospiraceae bacterium]
MKKAFSSSQPSSLVISTILVLLGVLILYLFLHQKNFTQEDWLGSWEISYFYDHEPDLVYTGTLRLGWEDSLQSYLEVYPPKSTRPEKLTLERLEISEDFRSISGQIVHKSYKISGGHLKEDFAFTLEQGDAFSGQGECLAYCAEGTMGISIVWNGNRSNLQ